MIAAQLIFHPAAVAEAEDAVRWYRERSPLAAKRFLAELNQVIDTIFDAPQRWLRSERGTRKVKLPCFPFLVIYRETKGAVLILAIAHGRRRPGYWENRL
ncbi:MAG: type II toxin-antitoxin system RelE/ParE family toxin [Candidatus Acidiferrum sp.]